MSFERDISSHHSLSTTDNYEIDCHNTAIQTARESEIAGVAGEISGGDYEDQRLGKYMLKQSFRSTAIRVYRAAPSLVRLLPLPLVKPAARLLFSRAREFDQKEDRYWIRHTMLPAIAKENLERIIFVGTAAYTYHYERPFLHSRTDFITIDPVWTSQIWGAKHHIVDRLENIEKYIWKSSADLVCFIGCLGFGTSESEFISAVSAAHKVLKPNGVLLWSHNSGRSPDLSKTGAFADMYTNLSVFGLPAVKQFETATLVIHLHVKKELPDQSLLFGDDT